jgi:hypothetical protein
MYKEGNVRVDPTMIKGMWRDIYYRKGPDGQDVLDHVTPWQHNIITQPFTYLAAGLLLGDPSFTGGILYHAIGAGAPSWDTLLPSPTKFDTQLFAEVNRRAPDGMAYIKAGSGTALSGSTTTIVDPSRVESCAIVGRFEPNSFFNGMTVSITAGTNAGESRTVSTYTQLTGTLVVAPAFPLPIDSTSVYEFTPVVSGTPTNVVRVTTTWPYGVPSDPFNTDIREMGLFGGTATATVNSGLLLDRITHAKISKTSTYKLVRVIDVTLRV